VLRPAFLPFEEQAPALHEVVSPLGPGAVALAASSQLTPQRLLVDEYSRSGGSYVLDQPATELSKYLHNRCGVYHFFCCWEWWHFFGCWDWWEWGRDRHVFLCVDNT
jgi:hypothetical protein